MEYISREEFLKQSDKVQREFKEYFDGESMLFWNNECLVYWGFEDILINTPAITEGQLRKFIEDKTECKICLEYYKTTGYEVLLSDIEHNKENAEQFNNWYEDLGRDLLQAYWKVACEIAKEELKHD
ncbi:MULTISPECIES: hypothetical protein [Clostridium]|uniref:Uncharacterized protein n=1 Tax=Clostridium carnis TaxID=1530 RepID=A0ABY6ST53_9CLOT|nr:hypothetical protein [Clostridium carnis]CAI3661464.1 conserved hypothetical protein [Clostridium neonatale]CAI3662051.1 conserved hypothetical protein [Clostridium neonatale]CAI3682262.1 conserved hypothetical protein [Clostridium neonatale]CAI3693767.1 conserved hypothetical protein [Clostridium neonatale]CAI3706275.1 conserved hypothetical protein [Clostridium neonatale]